MLPTTYCVQLPFTKYYIIKMTLYCYLMVKLIAHNQKRLLFTVNMYAADDHKTSKLL